MYYSTLCIQILMICFDQTVSQIGAQLGPSARNSRSPGGTQPLSSQTNTRQNRRTVVFARKILIGYRRVETGLWAGGQMGLVFSREPSEDYKGQWEREILDVWKELDEVWIQGSEGLYTIYKLAANTTRHFVGGLASIFVALWWVAMAIMISVVENTAIPNDNGSL